MTTSRQYCSPVSPSVPKHPEGFAMRRLDYHSAAQYLGLSYWTLRNMTQRGDLPFIRAGRRILIDRQDLDRWIESNKKQEELQ